MEQMEFREAITLCYREIRDVQTDLEVTCKPFLSNEEIIISFDVCSAVVAVLQPLSSTLYNLWKVSAKNKQGRSRI